MSDTWSNGQPFPWLPTASDPLGGGQGFWYDGLPSEMLYTLSFPYFTYSREFSETLPSDSTDLDVPYTPFEVQTVQSEDSNSVKISGAGYLIHLFKVESQVGVKSFTVNWAGDAQTAPSVSPVYLQIYNFSAAEWETIDSDSSSASAVNFSLSAEVNTSISDYYYEDNVAARVYQYIS